MIARLFARLIKIILVTYFSVAAVIGNADDCREANGTRTCSALKQEPNSWTYDIQACLPVSQCRTAFENKACKELDGSLSCDYSGCCSCSDDRPLQEADISHIVEVGLIAYDHACSMNVRPWAWGGTVDHSICAKDRGTNDPPLTTVKNSAGVVVESYAVVSADGQMTSDNGCATYDSHLPSNSPYAHRKRSTSATDPYVTGPWQYQDGSCKTGHPCLPASGTKVFEDADFTIPNSSLRLIRYYNSQGFYRPPHTSTPVSAPLLGDYWRTTYDRRLYVLTNLTNNAIVAFAAARPDGSIKYFTSVASGGREVGHLPSKIADRISNVAAGGWVVTTGDYEIETYDSLGRLVGLWDRNNFQQTLIYDAETGRLQSVTDAKNRRLTFSYTGDIQGYSGGTVTVTTPDNATFLYVIDSAGNLIAVNYPAGTFKKYFYEDSEFPNAVTGIQDENGQRYETVEYDGAGRVLASYLAPGASSPLNSIGRNEFTYNGNPLSTDIKGPAGGSRRVEFAINDGVLVPTKTTQSCSTPGACASTVENKYYDSAGYPQSTVDFNGNTTTYIYDDARGLETQKVEGVGTSSERTIRTEWDATVPLPTLRSVASGTGYEKLTKWTYSLGQLYARCDLDVAWAGAWGYDCGHSDTTVGVRQWKYSRCEAIGPGCPIVGLLLSIDGPRNDVSDITTFSYYESSDLTDCTVLGFRCHQAGDLFKITNALGRVTTYASYDRNGRVTRIQDPNGTYTELIYNSRGWLTSRVVRANADGFPNPTEDATTAFGYDAVGNITRLVDPDGVTTAFVYDGAHRLTDIYDQVVNDQPAGDYIHYTLDASGNRIEEITRDAGGTLRRKIARNYDQLNHLTKLLNSSGATVQEFKNPIEPPPPGITYNAGYDGNGNTIYTVDGNGVGTEQQYDPLNRLVKVLQDHTRISAATSDAKTEYTYDTRDNLLTVKDADNALTSYDFDSLDNLRALQSPDTGTTDNSYDAAGNIKTATDARGFVKNSGYDALNRLTSVTYPADATLRHFYFFDQSSGITGCASFGVGRLTAIVDQSGYSTIYCYDRRGNVAAKQQNTAGVTSTIWYTYTRGDRLSKIVYPSQAVISYTRDGLGQVISIDYQVTPQSSVERFVTNVTYLPFGPMSQLTFANGHSLTKLYDTDYAINTIASSAAAGLSSNVRVDLDGNIVKSDNVVLDYDPLNHLTGVSGGGVAINVAYSPGGDRLAFTLSTGTQQYTYVPNTHRLNSLNGQARLMDPSGNTVSLASSVSGGSANYFYNGKGERVLKNRASGTTTFLYSENGLLLGEYSGQSKQEYIYIDNVPVGIISNASGSTQTYYVETDQLGTPRNAVRPGPTTASDTFVWKWDSDSIAPWGNTLPSVEILPVNLRFPGQYYDAETGLHYNYFRNYEPSTGRFIESDPVGLKDDTNTYSYGRQNPLRYFDPNGKNAIQRWTVCFLLNLYTQEFCKANTSCAMSDTCERIQEKIAQKQLCIFFQQSLTSLCYPDDPTHQQRIKDEQNGIVRCEEMYSIKGCGVCRLN